MRRSPALALLFGGLAAGLGAQQTWIVDPTGAGNFTSLAPAIAAASPGDTLLLRGGDYPGPHLLSKALNILGDQPRPRVGPLQWTALPAGSPPMVLAGFDLVSAFMVIPFMTPQKVAFDGMTVACVALGSNWKAALHGCQLGGALDVYGQENREDGLRVGDSDVVVSQCTIDGGHSWGFWQGIAGCQVVPGGYAVHCVGGDITITGSTMRGPNSMPVALCGGIMSYAAEALHINGGTVRITDSALFAGNNAYTNVIPAVLAFGLPGTSNLEYDASTQFTPSTTVGSARFLPGTRGQSVPPGGTMTCRVQSGPNLPAALVASLGLGGPTPLPAGIAWIDPNAFVVLVIGFTDPSGALASAIPIPTWVPRGLPITVQSAVANGAAGPLVAGAPAVLHVR